MNLPFYCSVVSMSGCVSLSLVIFPLACHCSGLRAAGDTSCFPHTVPTSVGLLLVFTFVINTQVPELCYCVCA